MSEGDAQPRVVVMAPRVCTLCSIAIAIMLLFSALPHVGNPYAFASSVASYRLVGGWTALGIAFILPFVELTIAAALLFQPTYRLAGFVLSVVVFTIFVAAQGIAMARGLDISCGCFGAASDVIGTRSISIAALGLGMSCLGLCASLRTLSRKRVSTDPCRLMGVSNASPAEGHSS